MVGVRGRAGQPNAPAQLRAFKADTKRLNRDDGGRQPAGMQNSSAAAPVIRQAKGDRYQGTCDAATAALVGEIATGRHAARIQPSELAATGSRALSRCQLSV